MCFNSATICQWLEVFGQLLGSTLDSVDFMIGGPGIKVNLNNTKLS